MTSGKSCVLRMLLLVSVMLKAACPLGNRQDTDPPVITLKGSPSMTVEVGQAFVDPGATAFDEVDGDLSDQIQAVSTVNSSKAGSYTVTYSVSDSSGNEAAQVVREVIVRDPEAPYIFLEGESTIIVAMGKEYLDPGAIAIDEVDGDISHLIVAVNPVDTAKPGTYFVSYNVHDLAGNPAIEVKRKVIVDGAPPVITLLGDAFVAIPLGERYIDAGATAFDNVDGDVTSRIAVDNPVYTTSPQTFQVTYNVSDTAGNAAQQVVREVEVIDVSPPVIRLSGSSRIITLLGQPYLDPGATAEDNVDGDISSRIAVHNPVDTGAAGVYFVTYNVSDAAGNQASEVTRQVDVVVFQATFGRNAGRSDSGSDMIEVPGGNYLIVGTSASAGVGRPDIWVLKIDGAGQIVWNAVFGTSYNDYGYSLCGAADGNYLVLGWTESTRDTLVIKIDPSGTEIWRRTYEGTGYARAASILESRAGDILLTGFTVATGSSDQQLWVIKLDAAGNVLWSEDYGGSGQEGGAAITETPDGDYLIAGSTDSSGAGGSDFWLLKIDPEGNRLWDRSFGGTGADCANSVAQTSDGNCVVAGTTNSFGSGGNDAWVLKLNGGGDTLWSAVIGTGYDESGRDLVESSDGGLLLVGTRAMPLGISEDDLYVTRLSANGERQWERVFGGWRDDRGSGIIGTSDGFAAVVGTSSSYGDAYDDIWVLKF